MTTNYNQLEHRYVLVSCTQMIKYEHFEKLWKSFQCHRGFRLVCKTDVQKLISTSRMYKTLRTRVLYHDWDFAGTNKELAVGGLNAAFDLPWSLELHLSELQSGGKKRKRRKKKKKYPGRLHVCLLLVKI